MQKFHFQTQPVSENLKHLKLMRTQYTQPTPETAPLNLKLKKFMRKQHHKSYIEENYNTDAKLTRTTNSVDYKLYTTSSTTPIL